MTFEQAQAEQQRMEAEMHIAENRLKTYPRNEIGLTPDAVRQTEEYQRDRAAFNKLFDSYRTFNAWFVKTFKNELREQRRQHYPQRPQ